MAFVIVSDPDDLRGPDTRVVHVLGTLDELTIWPFFNARLGFPKYYSNDMQWFQSELFTLSNVTEKRLVLHHLDLPLKSNERSLLAYLAVLHAASLRVREGSPQVIPAFSYELIGEISRLEGQWARYWPGETAKFGLEFRTGLPESDGVDDNLAAKQRAYLIGVFNWYYARCEGKPKAAKFYLPDRIWDAMSFAEKAVHLAHAAYDPTTSADIIRFLDMALAEPDRDDLGSGWKEAVADGHRDDFAEVHRLLITKPKRSRHPPDPRDRQ